MYICTYIYIGLYIVVPRDAVCGRGQTIGIQIGPIVCVPQIPPRVLGQFLASFRLHDFDPLYTHRQGVSTPHGGAVPLIQASRSLTGQSSPSYRRLDPSQGSHSPHTDVSTPHGGAVPLIQTSRSLTGETSDHKHSRCLDLSRGRRPPIRTFLYRESSPTETFLYGESLTTETFLHGENSAMDIFLYGDNPPTKSFLY